jgi:hopanoid biosynthesis associated protein HpnK
MLPFFNDTSAAVPAQQLSSPCRRRHPALIDWEVRRLIINADDFGLTRGVNRAVMELHSKDALTSATLMARAAATEEAIEEALKTPSLRVGCHVVLLDGQPVLSPRDLPTLADENTGRFHSTLATYLRLELTGRIRAAEVEAEAATQIAVLQRRGLRLTHIDTHKHTHVIPGVLRSLLRAARAAGITSVRNPFEPAWSLRATFAAPVLRRMEVWLLRKLEPVFRRIVAEEGFTTTDGAVGVLATGTLDEASIRSLLANMPPGTWELITHPGYNDAELGQVQTRLKESREKERQALMAMGRPDGVELISFAQIAGDESEIAMDSPVK